MAMGIVFRCNACPKKIEAWDEGHPYYVNELGKKVYAYHPDRERDQCTRIESDVICLECGRKTRSDDANPTTVCKKCGSSALHDTYHLDGQRCPFCKKGTFVTDPESTMIS